MQKANLKEYSVQYTHTFLSIATQNRLKNGSNCETNHVANLLYTNLRTKNPAEAGLIFMLNESN